MNLKNTKAHKLTNTAIIFLLLAPFVVLFYAVYLYNPAHAENTFLYILMLIGDTIGIITVIGLWVTIIMDIIVPDHHSTFEPKDVKKFLSQKPKVDIFITVYGEPKEIIEKTLSCAMNVKGVNKVYVLDDKNEKFVQELCKKYKAIFIVRDGNEFAKAGNINNGLIHSKSDYFVILDADQAPKKELIETLIPYMSDDKLALVQSPQVFGNTHEFIASGTSQAQEIFYKYALPAKNTSNSVFCVGTNVLYRRSAIDQIGGISKISHSEDIWTSINLHKLGWKTLFVSRQLAQGLAPNTISAYFNQQLRWARGGIGMLLKENPLFIKELTFDQKIQYFLSNIFFLVGIPMLLYLLFPILYLLFDIKPLISDPTWLFHYVPYLVLYYTISWLLISKFHISSLAVSIATFYPYLLALVSEVFEKDHKWVSTSSKSILSKVSLKIQWTWSHILIQFLTVFALIIGWYEPANISVTAFYSILAIWNFYLIYLFLTGEGRRINHG